MCLKSFGHIPRGKIARSYGSYIFSFLRNSVLISIVTVLIYISTSSKKGPPPFPAFPEFTVFCVLDDGHSDWRRIPV